MTTALIIIACLIYHTKPSSSFRWTDLRHKIITFRSYTQSKFSLKYAPIPDLLARYGAQVYGVATYDGLFKLILDDPEVRPSFFHALAGINVTSSERLDESMNPLQELQLLRKFISSGDTLKTVAKFQKNSGFEVPIKRNNQTTEYTPIDKGTHFLSEFLNYFGDIINACPTESYKRENVFCVSVGYWGLCTC